METTSQHSEFVKLFNGKMKFLLLFLPILLIGTINASPTFIVGTSTVSGHIYYFAENGTTNAVIYGYASAGNPNAGNINGSSARAVIQKAINNSVAAGYGVIYFKPGTYWMTFGLGVNGSFSDNYKLLNTSLAVINKTGTGKFPGNSHVNLTLEGPASGPAAILKLANNQNCDIIYAMGYDAFTIQNLTFDGNNRNNTYATDGAALILTGGGGSGPNGIDRTGLQVINVKFQNIFNTGFYSGNNGHIGGVDQGARISNDMFLNGSSGSVGLELDTTFNTIANNLYMQNVTIGLYTDGPAPNSYNENVKVNNLTELNVYENIFQETHNGRINNLKMNYRNIVDTYSDYLQSLLFYQSTNITVSNSTVMQSNGGSVDEAVESDESSNFTLLNDNISAENLPIVSYSGWAYIDGGKIRSLNTSSQAQAIDLFAYDGNIVATGTSVSGGNSCYSVGEGTGASYLYLYSVSFSSCGNKVVGSEGHVYQSNTINTTTTSTSSSISTTTSNSISSSSTTTSPTTTGTSTATTSATSTGTTTSTLASTTTIKQKTTTTTTRTSTSTRSTTTTVRQRRRSIFSEISNYTSGFGQFLRNMFR